MGQQPLAAHPILACADAIEAALKDVADVDPAFMRTGEKAEALRRLDRLESQLAGLRMRVMANAGEVAETTADHSVATWLAVETRTDPRARFGDLALARGLDRRWLRLGAAVREGSVNLAQARVIAHALEDLPEKEVGSEAIGRAEEALVGYAATVRSGAPAAAGATDPPGRRPGGLRGGRGQGARAGGTPGRRGDQPVAAPAGRRHDPDQRAAGRRTWRTGCGPTSTPTPPPDIAAWEKGIPCRPDAGWERRSRRSWRTSTPTGCRCTVATRPRCWSPST